MRIRRKRVAKEIGLKLFVKVSTIEREREREKEGGGERVPPAGRLFHGAGAVLIREKD
jgi:hypothetical protein